MTVTFTDDEIATAVASNSHACLIANAIRRQHPELTRVDVDMATIRFSDREAGERYFYLTPPEAQHVLLSLDQGWPLPTRTVTIKRAVHISPITRATPNAPSRVAEREASRRKHVELEERDAAGETLTRGDRISLSLLRRSDARTRVERPTTPGAASVTLSKGGAPVVRGGRPPVTGPSHPNLLRGRNRIFGAKLADPGRAFDDAVEQAVAQRLRDLDAPR